MISDPSYVVGIGSSAGGLEAITRLLNVLPSTTGMAFVVVSHMSPTAESHLAEILSRATRMPVIEARQGIRLQKNQVYVIPKNTDIFIRSGSLILHTPRTMHRSGRHSQVDQFLTSLSEAKGERAIGIILSGGDGDGTEGCKSIKKRGGRTFAQDCSARFASMPVNATEAGCIDFVMNPEDIARELEMIAYPSSTFTAHP